MGDMKNSNNNTNSNKNLGKKNGNVDKTRVGSKSKSESNSNDTTNKTSKNKGGKKNVSNGANLKNSGTKSLKQEIQTETSRSANNSRGNKSKMVDSTTQTSTPLRLHLDSMFEDIGGGYQRSSPNSVESEFTEDEDDDLVSELGSPLSSHRSSARTSFSTKEPGYGYSFKFEWAQNSKKQQQLLIHNEARPRCFQDLDNSHEFKLLKLTEQLNALITSSQDYQ